MVKYAPSFDSSVMVIDQQVIPSSVVEELKAEESASEEAVADQPMPDNLNSALPICSNNNFALSDEVMEDVQM